MPILLALAGLSHAAVPFAGLEWRPLSRADVVWVEEQRTSGFAVGEFDGVARPSLQAYGGAWFGRVGLSGALGVARLQNTTQVGEVISHRHWGVVRPSLDVRFAFTERRPHRALPYALVGLHADIPSARDLSNAYTEEERLAADEAATTARARLAGLGARAGLGADYRITGGVTVGAMYTLQWHRGILRTGDMSIVSQWLAAEAAILVTFEWPRREVPPPVEAVDEPAAEPSNPS